MDGAEYIGMDVHKETVSIAVTDSADKVAIGSVIEMSGSRILQFIHGLRETFHVRFEEAT